MSSKTKALDKSRSMDTLKRILSCIAQYKWGVMLSLFLALITVALTLYVPILTGRAVDQIVSTGHVNFSGLTTILWKILGAVGLTAVAQWMMNHINNTARASLNGRTPFELASLLRPDTLLRGSGAAAIPHDEVLLKPRLLKMSLP